jgi:hypothetical protein
VPGFPCAHGDHLLVCNVFIEDAPPGLAFYVEQPYATWRLAGTRHPAPVRLRRLAAAATGRPSLRDEQQPVLPDSLAAPVEASVAWQAAPASAVDRRLKRRAIRAYRSQVAIFGTPLLGAIALYERAWGGEGIGRLARAEGTPPLLPAFGKKA